MNVPLILNASDKDAKQYLRFWRNSEEVWIRSPFNPFFYSKKEELNCKNELVNKTLLYDKDYTGQLYKCSFSTTKDLYENRPDDAIEGNVQFRDRVFIDRPDILKDYAHTDDLKVMAFDIETDSYLTFPTAEENAIIAIGIKLNDNPTEIYMSNTHKDDREILLKFIERVKELDPDIICDYNGKFFDWPYIMKRLEINGIYSGGLSRNSAPLRVDDYGVHIGGRIHYDIFDRSVMRDQNLFKEAPKNKRLKTISRMYGMKDVIEEPPEIMSNMRSIVNTERLSMYLTSDVDSTMFLCNIYLPTLIGMAEYIQVALNSIVNGPPSYVGNILFSRKFGEMGIISDMTVEEAYPYLSNNKQGAYVGCFKPGLYLDGIRKFDVQSYYPNLMRTLNLCPTTTRIVGTERKLQPYSASMSKDNFLTLSIPDEKANRQVIIEIDFNKKGFASDFVDATMEDRLELKRKMAEDFEFNSAEWNDADVNQLNLKVIMNSITGYFGQRFAKFGSLACYIAITGTGRYLISKLIEEIGEREVGHKTVGNTVALDTDGIVIDSDHNIDDTNEWLEQYVLETFSVPKNYILLEEELFKAAYFNEGKKQYLLLEEDRDGNDELVIHGISFKGSSLPKLYSNVIEEVGFALLTGADNDSLANIIDKYYDQSEWSLDLLKKAINVKPILEYKSGTPIGKQIAKQYTSRFGLPIEHQVKLEYVKIGSERLDKSHKKQKAKSNLSPYQLVTIFDSVEDVESLDTEYYIEVVDKAIERLGLGKLKPSLRAQKSLFDF